ncbi:hypothetical protein, partial [Brevundimonas sp. KM4]|uniref:hypothetical protein n=1 Tax=Brevundimonas sp. KM4 TaxID=1628191 RepID=UPI001E4A7222
HFYGGRSASLSLLDYEKEVSAVPMGPKTGFSCHTARAQFLNYLGHSFRLIAAPCPTLKATLKLHANCTG